MKLIESSLWPSRTPPAPAYCGEDERLSVLASFDTAGLIGDEDLAQTARFAARLCGTPIALVTIVEQEVQRFLAGEGIDVATTPRPTSFCARAMLGSEIMVIGDAREDERFAENPLVTGPPHIRFYAGAPLISPEGAPIGALCVIDPEPRSGGLSALQAEGLTVLARSVMRRLVGHRHALESSHLLSSSERRFEDLAHLVPDIVWSADADGKVDYVNDRFFAFTGLSRDTFDPDDFLSFGHEDDYNAWHAQWGKAREDVTPYRQEFRMRDKDGGYRWMIARAEPATDHAGKLLRWYGSATDIDDAHRELEDQNLVSSELAHRIKNIFAVIAGLVTLRTRGNDALRDFGEELNATIRALGRAQDFVRPVDNEKGEELLGLIEVLMQPYMTSDGRRVRVEGEPVPIGAKSATPLALIIHELATNAAKYGALSEDGGRVEIALSRESDEVVLTWREQGGPPVSAPTSEGFGTRLVTMATRNQLGGEYEADWHAHGLEVRLRIPLARVAS